MTFGQHLKSLRKDSGLSQDALAAKLYVTRQSVSQWETDKSMPSVDLLLKLSQIFEVSVDSLLGKDAPEAVPLVSAHMLTEKKEIRRAAHFRFNATVTLLFCTAAAVLLLLFFQLSLYPAIYQGLPYVIQWYVVADDAVAAGGAVITAMVLLYLRLRYRKRAAAFAAGLSGQVDFYTDNLVLTDKEGLPTTFFYANLKRIYENDCFLSVTLPNRQTIILNKAELTPVLPILAGNKSYKCKKLSTQAHSTLSVRRAWLLQTGNNALFVAAITMALGFVFVLTMLFTNGSLSAGLRWIAFLLPWITAAAATAVGIWECAHKLRAKRLIISGASALLFLTIMYVSQCCLVTLFQFNMRALPPQAFLSVAASHALTVTEANRDNPEDFLWECYSAKNEDGTIEITYLHFQEEMRWTSVRSARGAFDRIHSRERAKTNNALFGSQMDYYVNAFSAYSSGNGRYYYISQNRYTVVAIATDAAHRTEAETIFADYKLILP